MENKAKQYKAVVADVDGTIIPPTELIAPGPTKRLIKAVAGAKKRGVVFSLATGRSVPHMEKLIAGLNLDSPIIVDNGAKIYDTACKKYLWQSLIPKAKAQKILAELKTEGSLKVYITDDNRRIEDINQVDRWKISKIVILSLTPERAEKLYQRLKAISGVTVTRSISGLDPVREAVHINSAGATKQIALFKLGEILGIKTKEMIGIGDSYNDFPFLMACGLKVAMANAIPEIREIADFIAPSYQEDGVAYILEKFILKV